MRTVLVGAAETSRVALETLTRLQLTPAAVLTLPTDQAYRHWDFRDLRPVAGPLGIPVLEVSDLNAPDTLAALRGYQPDLIFVIGWSQILSSEFLAIARLGAIGFHPSLLPEDRGPAVIPWTILQGKGRTGATLFWLDEGIDSGDILLQQRIPVAPDETAATLYAKHQQALARMLEAAVPLLLNGTTMRRSQDESRATYCARLDPDDGLIDWHAPADQVWRVIRALVAPYSGAFTYRKDRKIWVWSADYVGFGPYVGLAGQVQALQDGGALVMCGDRRMVRLKQIQPEGERRSMADHMLRRYEKLGVSPHHGIGRGAIEESEAAPEPVRA